MADQSYLFGGATPASVSATLTDTGVQLPAWLQEYTRGLAGQATAVAGEAYQPYTSPTNAATYGQDAGRIAGFTPAQQQAQQQVMASQGNYQPALNQAGNIQAQALANAQATPGTYQPYLNAASQSSVQNIGSYMSPYTDSVVNRIAQLGQRNLSENLLPQINTTFTGAGQFGSTRNADFTNRALRDTNESILGQQSSALQSGYQNAITASQADLARQALLASTAGNLSNQTTSNLNALGQSQSALGQLTQQLGLQQAGALETVGQTQQAQQQQNMNLAQTDYTNQLNYPKTQLSFLSDIIRGQPTGTAGFTSVTNPTATAAQMSPLAAAAQGFLGARTLASTSSATK